VTGEADEPQGRLGGDALGDRLGVGHGDAELGLAQAGGQVGVGLGVDVRVDAEGDAGADAGLARARSDPLELLERLRVDGSDLRGDRRVDLVVALADAREDDLLRGEAGREDARELATRDDVAPAPSRARRRSTAWLLLAFTA
jgi:hypothetical protein